MPAREPAQIPSALVLARELVVARAKVEEVVEQAKVAASQYVAAVNRVELYGRATAALDVGVNLTGDELNLPSNSRDAISWASSQALTQREEAVERMRTFEQATQLRLQRALELYDIPEISRRITTLDRKTTQGLVARLRYTLVKLQSAYGWIDRLRERYSTLLALASKVESNRQNAQLFQSLFDYCQQTHEALSQLRSHLTSVSYPFPHARGRIAISDYLVPELPDIQDFGAVVEASGQAIESVFHLYHRAIAHLILVAEEVEAALGFPEAEASAGLDGYNPAGVSVDPKKARLVFPHWFGLTPLLLAPFYVLYRWRRRSTIRQHVALGDARAAVVVSLQPLLVAAYTDEIDCVVLLQFPDELAQRYQLKIGSRLLAANTYLNAAKPQADLIPGEGALENFNQVHPLITDFVSNDMPRIEMLKNMIGEDEWKRAAQLAVAYLKEKGRLVRDGTGNGPWQEARKRSV